MQTERTTVRRRAQRGRYERAEVEAILDAAPICHVGFTAEHGPVVLPTIHARDEHVLYLHGSPVSAMLASIDGSAVCVTATIVDGLVFARSAFHHSMNYRSVVVFGTGRVVASDDEKLRALRAVVEHVAPGRWQELRPTTGKEIAATKVIALDLDEASAKVRTGPPIDDDEDLPSQAWGGVVPLAMIAGAPIADEHTPDGTPVPDAVAAIVGPTS
jgi:nitroimidazol reductase NimA-like FMN-containing flavoprotein (pyridoxamine 5'-phosphate oxidase superfamily)